MTHSRLGDALAEAGGWPAAGRIVALRPTMESDLSALPKERAVLVTGFRPDHEALGRQGWTVSDAAEGAFAAAVLFLPRAKALGRALIHRAAGLVPKSAPIWIDGQKHDGIDTALKDLKARAEVGVSLSKAHGRAFMIASPGAEAFADWEGRVQALEGGFVTRPGVFSADGVDPGSALLARHLPGEIKGKVADLGAGWGWLAAEVLKRGGVSVLHLIEAEAEALACARDNITDDRAQFHWADARSFRPGQPMDMVVMNPPFHASRAADPGLGLAFIAAARAMLKPSGELWLVANRTLPYEEPLQAAFLEVRTIATEGGFKVIKAVKPRFGRT